MTTRSWTHLRTLADPDDDADHITVRVLRRVWREDKQAYEDNGVLIGAALLSGRALARRILRSEAPVDFQEPLLLRGVSIGTLHGSAARAKGRLLTKAAEPLDAARRVSSFRPPKSRKNSGAHRQRSQSKFTRTQDARELHCVDRHVADPVQYATVTRRGPCEEAIA